MNEILMLSSAEKSEDLSRNEWFADSLNYRLGHSGHVKCVGYDGLAFEFSSHGTSIYLRATHKPLSDFALIYFKSAFRNTEISTVIARYLKKHNVPFLCDEHLEHQPVTKLSQLDRLGDEGISIPHTFYVSASAWRTSYSDVTKLYQPPFILKAVDGLKGDQNYLIHDETEYNRIVMEQQGVQFIAEEFLPNDGDYRVLVLDSVAGMVIERRRDTSQETHLNNTSQGGHARLIDLQDFEPEILDMAVRSAAVLGRNVAGVDVLIRNTDQKVYILEVNASPQISSGAYVDEKLDMFAAFLASKLRGKEETDEY